MLSLKFLGVSFSGLVVFGFEQVQVSPPVIGEPFFGPDAVLFEQFLEPLEGLMGAASEDESHHLAAVKILDPPKPALVLLVLHERPLFVSFEPENELFGCFGTGRVDRSYGRRFFLIVLITVFILTFKTRAVSRMPLPFIAMSKICSLIPGLQAVLV